MSNKELDFNEVLFATLNSNGFVEILAHQIAMQYGEKLMDDFGNQITKKLGDYVEKQVEEYINDYVLEANIKQRVAQVFRNIDKVELLEALKEKP